MSGLDKARAILRARLGAGARRDAAGAPGQTLAQMRLGTAYFARKLAEVPDSALADPAAFGGQPRAFVVAAVALQARAICWAIEAGEGASDPSSASYLADLATCASLPPRALRHLFDHTAIHLNVVWRDLPDASWDDAMRGQAEDRARMIWQSALALGNGRMRDLPLEFRPMALQTQDPQ